MTHGWTTREQSRKLIELGIDARTADMYYSWIGTTYYPHAESYKEKIAWRKYYAKTHNNTSCCTSILPCWSLTALLELMPNSIGDSNKNICWFDNAFWCAYMDEDSCMHDGTSADNPLDAAFNMVVWLIEQKHIKVKK